MAADPRDSSSTSTRDEAFLSYSHQEPDRDWARWLHRALETWRTPRALVREKGAPARLAPVFRDEEELAASADLSGEIDAALLASRFLVVVCSPRAAASRWVNEEVVRFQRLGRADRVLALWIEGDAAAAFPPALRRLRPATRDARGVEEADPLAADVRPPAQPRGRRDRGRAARRRTALLRLLAPMLGCSFDDLRRREQARRRRRLWLAGVAAAAVMAAIALPVTLAVRAGQETQAARDDVRLLAVARRVHDLRERARTLFPRDAASVEAVGPLLEEASREYARLDEHRRALAGLASRALAPAGEPPRFAREEDRASWQALSDLAADAEALGDPQRGLAQAVARRFQRPPTPDAAALWRATADDVADRVRSPAYGGLTLAPQFGLHPLGKDPDSGLHEFAHLYSGSLPRRGPDGRLVLAEDAALVFVLLPGGLFWQGAATQGARNLDPDAEGREGPVHLVRLSPFFLSKYECTQAQWERLADGARPSWFTPGTPGVAGVSGRSPVERVSWEDAVGTPGWLTGYGLTLPTEARWEYGCRAPLTGAGQPLDTCDPWWCGPDDEELAQAEVVLVDDGTITQPVGSRRPNRFGLYDMLGNVSEWCLEFLEDGYYQDLAGEPLPPLDPPGPRDRAGREVSARVLRGGNYTTVASRARASKRDVKWDAARRGATVGLRPTRDLAPAP